MIPASRIEELRRRVELDPASIAFAQLAEEYRRAGNYEDAVEVSRRGLAVHPGYLSARVTLGRALIELKRFDEAKEELEHVLQSAPENLAALRGLADILHQKGALTEALAIYESAHVLAPNDPDLYLLVEQLRAGVNAMQESPSVSEVSANAPAVEPPGPISAAEESPRRLLRVFEAWLVAINVTRAQRRA
jgi:tetratricopeptide (TPR) repeat protein